MLIGYLRKNHQNFAALQIIGRDLRIRAEVDNAVTIKMSFLAQKFKSFDLIQNSHKNKSCFIILNLFSFFHENNFENVYRALVNVVLTLPKNFDVVIGQKQGDNI